MHSNVYDFFSCFSPFDSLCPSDLLCALCLKYQRNQKIRAHPKWIQCLQTPSSEHDDLWIKLGQILHLFVREHNFFSLFGNMNLAHHQSLCVCSFHTVPKTTAYFSLSFGHSGSICYYALFCGENSSMSFCNGCQGLEEMCFQLPLARMTDG